MRLNELFESTRLQQVVVYAGRFQPFHLGHKQVFDWLANKFGAKNVYILTSNKTEPGRSPWDFEDKKTMITATGIPADRVVQVANPYKADEVMRLLNLNDQSMRGVQLIYAVGQKDMEEDPRFTFKAKKDGSPSYLQPYSDHSNVTMDKHGLVVAVPTFTFRVLGKPVISATDVRRQLSDPHADKTELLQGLYGAGYKQVAPIISKVFN